MKKLLLPLLLCGALLFAISCSRDSNAPTAPSISNDVTSAQSPSDKGDPGIDATKPSFAAPVITIVGQTATTISVQVCGGVGNGTTIIGGAPAGFSLQWAPLGCNAPCAWTDVNSCAASFSGVPGGSRYNLDPGECVTVVVGNLVHDIGESDSNCPLACGTRYVFRAFAHATSTVNRSAFTAALCGGTLDCAAPSVVCASSTANSITVTVTASSTGAPAGVEVWVNGSLYGTTGPLAPNASTNFDITGLECGTSYLIKVRAARSNCSGGSGFSDEITCCTNLCAPTAVCGTPTATSVFVIVTAGGGIGAPAGIDVVWGGGSANTGPLGPGESYTVEVAADCGTSVDFTITAVASTCYGASTPISLTCCTNLCAPAISCGETTQSSIALNVTPGGGAGAPAGVVVQYAVLPAGVACDAYDWATHTDVTVTDFTQPLVITELNCEVTLVFRAVLPTSGCYGESAYTPNVCCSTDDCDEQNNNGGCTRTRGFWATHGPGTCHQGNNADILSQYVGSITLCGNAVTAEQACTILSANGGGCNQLGAQLVAAKLNSAAFGTALPTCAADAEAAYCAGTGCTSDLIQCLDTFNNSGEHSVNCPSGF